MGNPTYFLPEFYNLNAEEQAAILFHESYWIFKPTATYLEVVRAEMAFQKFVQEKHANRYDPALARTFGELFGQHIGISMALAQDLRSGNLAGLGAVKGGLAFSSLFAPGPVYCGYRIDASWLNGAEVYGDGSVSYIYELHRKFPKSLFLAELLQFLAPDQTGKYGAMGFYWNREGHEPVGSDCRTLKDWRTWTFRPSQITSVINEPLYKGEKTTNRHIDIMFNLD